MIRNFFEQCYNKFFIRFQNRGIFPQITSISLVSKKELRDYMFYSLVIIALFLSKILVSKDPYIKYIVFCLGSIVFGIAMILLSILLVIFVMDHIYRPNVPQYPWNIWIDRVIPIFFLISPTVTIILFNPFTEWFYAFCLLLVLHIFVILPILQKWSSLRRWKTSEEEIPFSSWRHPRLYAHISIALVYPLLWGIYFSLSRFLHLGQEINITDHMLFSFDILTISLFLFYPLFLWFLAFREIIPGLRNYLWEEFLSLVVSLNQRLLPKKVYFLISKKLHKFSFMLASFFNILSMQEVYPVWAKILWFIYRPLTFPSIIFGFVFVELLYTGGIIYYGAYVLFVYPLFRGICFCINEYAWHQFVLNVCKADFVSGNWKNPRYPYTFWEYALDSEFYYNLRVDSPSEDVMHEMSKNYIRRFRKVVLFKHNLELRWRVAGLRKVLDPSCTTHTITRTGLPRSICMQFAADYYAHQAARWTHSSVAMRPLHSATAVFLKNPIELIALINRGGWSHFGHVEKFAPKDIRWPQPQELYDNIPSAVPDKPTTISDVMETNLAVGFHKVIPHVGTFNEMTAKYPKLPVEANQACPDILIFNPLGPTLIGIDQKATRFLGVGRNEAFSVSSQKYRFVLNAFETQIKKEQNHGFPCDVKTQLDRLSESCVDANTHFEVWNDVRFKFPNNYIPPCLLQNHFQKERLTPQAAAKLAQADETVQRVSDYLYSRKVPQLHKGKYVGPEDIFNESFMQNL